ncbi:Septin-domain-containing protein [Parasitella parasitica]|nr:Septin-domain-containing protein [Parasitella parasitica]
MPPFVTLPNSNQPIIGIAHLPNQRHKIVTNKGVNFNIMVCGESGTGKSTFVNTLFSTALKDPKDLSKRQRKQLSGTVEIEITKTEIEENKFKVKLSIIDTPGFGDYVNSHNSWVPISEFIDDQHERYMRQEQQPYRNNKVDMRVHACLYFIRPTGHCLKPLDIEMMKRLGSRVNLIPVIAKADTLTPKDLAAFKQRIRNDIEHHHIKVYQCPSESDDEHVTQSNKAITSAMPFSVIGSIQDVQTVDGRTVKGRAYSWGVAEVENEQHCDFKKLRHLLIRSHMSDIIETTELVHYENYRLFELSTRKSGEAKSVKAENPKYREKEESLRKEFTEQVKKEETRFRQWETKLVSERDRLNKDLETSHAQIKAMQSELEALYRKNGSSIRR